LIEEGYYRAMQGYYRVMRGYSTLSRAAIELQKELKKNVLLLGSATNPKTKFTLAAGLSFLRLAEYDETNQKGFLLRDRKYLSLNS
jgi:hypothetical protein